MVKSHVEDLAVEYFMKEDYFVMRNILFPQRKEVKRGTTSPYFQTAWNDIDILASKPGEIAVVQCKTCISDMKETEKTIEWFKDAIRFIRTEKPYKNWSHAVNLKKIAVAEELGKKHSILLEKNGIETITVDEMLRNLLKKLKDKKSCREESVLLRIMKYMVIKDMINEEFFKEK